MSKPRKAAAVAAAFVSLATVVSLVAATGAGARSAAAPVNTKEPSVSGVPLVGNTLTGDRGTWDDATTFAYVWQRCDDKGADCATIAGATTTTYKLVNDDAGSVIRFVVTATNKDGSTKKDSNGTSVVQTESGIPLNSKPPTITGTPTVGSTLTADTGKWVGTEPITYSYQWVRCDQNGNACALVTGATKSTYDVAQSVVGKTLRVGITARNSRGTTQAFSVNTAVVTDTGGGGGGGIIVLPDGSKSVDVKDVPKGERLIVWQVKFDPSPVTSRETPINARIRVQDTRGYWVRNAIVFIRSTPILTSGGDGEKTTTDGTLTYALQPRDDFPLRNGYNVQFFVKAYRTGDDPLAGISGTRLVQVATKAP